MCTGRDGRCQPTCRVREGGEGEYMGFPPFQKGSWGAWQHWDTWGSLDTWTLGFKDTRIIGTL